MSNELNLKVLMIPVALVAIAIIVETCGDKLNGYWAPSGYVERANKMVHEGVLELVCKGEQDFIRFKPRAAKEREWFHESKAVEDVRVFNENPTSARSPFRQGENGCELIEVDPFYHRVNLPYSDVRQWTGEVHFDSASADLHAFFKGGRDQHLQLMAPRQRGRPDSDTTVDLRDKGVSWRGERLGFKVANEIVADIYYVGKRPVIALGTRVADLILNGYELPQGSIAWLETGDWIHFRHGDDTFTYVVEVGRDLQLISSREGSERRYMIPRLAPFVGALAQAFEKGLQSAHSRSMDALDIRLTLDRELETSSQNVVNDWCREQVMENRPRAVSALVMDAESGAVLAMPSCPGAQELDGYDALSTRQRNRYLRNQNLTTHPVGSALKPFWAASVATAFPRLLDLKLPAHGKGARDVFGCTVPFYKSIGHEDWHGIEEFIETSCNRFMVEMATVALMAGTNGDTCQGQDAKMADCLEKVRNAASADSGVGGRIRFCGQPLDLVLRNSSTITRDSCGFLKDIHQYFPRAPLDRLTGARTYWQERPADSEMAVSVRDAYGSDRYRLDLWADLINSLKVSMYPNKTMTAKLGFRGVSPEVTNLGLNTVDRLRDKWVSLLLGGESSRWSNFQLAEAMSRLMTGRDVRGRLVLEPSASGVAAGAEPLPEDVLHPGARRRVLNAMELVITGPSGTGRRLNGWRDSLQNDVRRLPGLEEYEVYLFAKTGTPNVDVYANVEALEESEAPEKRKGSVLVLGVLIVPPEAGRVASRKRDVWFTACTEKKPRLKAGVLGVPPVNLLGDVDALGVTMAVYLDDLDPDGNEHSAVDVAIHLMAPLRAYLTERLDRQLHR